LTKVTAIPAATGIDWEMFGPLLYARVGDPIILHNYSTGVIHTFHISKVVGRTNYRDVRWLHATSSGPMLTLQTCIDSTQSSDRFIVQAT
jgi:sortase (surface protein transpeptidase)